MGCLYRIAFPNGKAYIGITAETAKQRFSEHVYNSVSGRGNRAVNRALRKYGSDAVLLETLVVAEWDYLVEIERKAIAAFETFGSRGYNMTAGGEGALGYKHTVEALAKMGAVHKGKAHHSMPHTPEAKAKMSAAQKGRTVSAETREKISRSLLGNQRGVGSKWTDERRAAQIAMMTGIDRGDEWRRKMSEVSKIREAKRRAQRNGHGC